MIQSQGPLRQLISGSALEHCELVELPILDTGELAFALDIEVNELEQSWIIARQLLNQTGRWPVVVACWSGVGGSFAERVLSEDIFSRFFFKEAPHPEDVSPRTLIQKSRTIDVSTFIDTLAKERDHYDKLDECLDWELAGTKEVRGHAPNRIELDDKSIKTRHQLDRWLLDWELANGGLGNPEHSRFDWFDPKSEFPFLLLLPISSPWETLAYLNWYGTSDHGSEYYIALGRSWEERFGAELVAHYGTMLGCFVSRPPADPRSAWEVAREHDLVAPCTLGLPGVTVRHYANGLANYDRWFLHERP